MRFFSTFCFVFLFRMAHGTHSHANENKQKKIRKHRSQILFEFLVTYQYITTNTSTKCTMYKQSETNWKEIKRKKGKEYFKKRKNNKWGKNKLGTNLSFTILPLCDNNHNVRLVALWHKAEMTKTDREKHTENNNKRTESQLLKYLMLSHICTLLSMCWIMHLY